MADTALTNSELVVLSLILEQPRHGYDIEQEITRRNMRVWTDLSTSSIYYVIRRLQEKNAVEELEPADGGRGAPRHVYRITSVGERAWQAATLQALSRPTVTYTSFLIGLHNLWNVAPSEALPAVRSYREWLAGDLQRQRTELEKLGVSFFPLDVLFEYGFVLGDAELGFLDKLIARLEGMRGAAQASSSTKNIDHEGDDGDGT